MGKEIEIIEKEFQNTLEINIEVPMWKMPSVIGNSYKTIVNYLKSKNLEPSEAPYVRYLNIDWDILYKESKLTGFFKMFTRKWSMLIGFPVKEKLEGGKYVKAMHKGPYQKCGETYKKMISFMKQENLQFKNESIEYYLNDPKTVKKEDLETLVLIHVS
ncbi:MAG: GyrI-like domain-containing protein [Ignavibacteria bacterium]|jgi:effector-binding domain-containing protein